MPDLFPHDIADTQGRASADHTTLLLNCYTKLKDVDKLDSFLRGDCAAGSGAAGSSPSLNFDVETAVKVLVYFLCQPYSQLVWGYLPVKACKLHC